MSPRARGRLHMAAAQLSLERVAQFAAVFAAVTWFADRARRGLPRRPPPPLHDAPDRGRLHRLVDALPDGEVEHLADLLDTVLEIEELDRESAALERQLRRDDRQARRRAPFHYPDA